MGRKILVTDDDPVIRILISECLSCYGHEVITVSSGKECLEKLTGDLPEVLLLDLMMPDMNGMEVLKKLRDNPNTAQVPVIMLSANAEKKVVEEDKNAQANQYLEKPFDLKTLLQAVEDIK